MHCCYAFPERCFYGFTLLPAKMWVKMFFFVCFFFLLSTPQTNKHSRQQEHLPDCSFPRLGRFLLNQLLLLLTSNPLLWKSRRSPIGTLTHTRVCLLWTFLLRSTCQIFSFEYHCSSERFIVSFLQYWLFHTPWIKFIYILNKVEIKASCPIFFPHLIIILKFWNVAFSALELPTVL